MTGQLVGHYRIVEKIGAGGMGEVFRARDERLDRDVALKLIRPASSDNPDHLRRFEQEARAAAALNHPNILAIYDVGFEGKTPYIVSELLEGKTLRQRMFEGPFSVQEATAFALQIAHGLAAAHARHIVHRDLKPENLFLTEDGRVKILDFGVAKLQLPEDNRPLESLTTVTKSGAVVGTVAYMSPEQLRGKPVDFRSDLFSFGAILYEMLTGCRAFRGETEVDTMTAVLREEPHNEELSAGTIPAQYQDIIKHCLEKEPENRFQSTKDLIFALLSASGSSPDRAVAPALARHPQPKRAFSRALITVLGLAVIVLTVLILRPISKPLYQRLTFEDGTIYSARFSPDGRSIVYSAAWNNNPVEIFSTVGNSLLAQPLNLSDANLLAISPSNELAIILHGTHNGQLETVDGVLASAPMAGGSPRELLPGVRWADWDAQGKLAIVHDVDGHCRLEYPIGHVLYESAGWISNLRFSPRYDSIAVMDHPALWDDRGTIAVVDLSGHVRALGGNWKTEHGIAWRPDGNEIWFTATNKGHDLNLFAIDLSGNVRPLLNLPVAVTLQDISSDGRLLVTLNSRRLAMAASTLRGKQDVDVSWHDWNLAHDISLDGQSILFEDASEAAGPTYSVAVRKIDGSLPIRLGEGSAGGLSPDGKWALSISTSSTPQVTLLPIGAGQSRTINVRGVEHISNGWARFLPNAQQFAINGSQKTGGSRCYVVNLSNGESKAVTPEGVRCGPFSPDGKSLIGVGPNQSLTIYDLAGRPARLIAGFDPRFHPLQWSTDGSLYGYHLGEFPSKIYKTQIATGKETVIQELSPRVSAGVVTVAPIVVNRDGTSFAYCYNQTLSSLYLISGVH